MERNLAADVAGYSRLKGADEEATLDTLLIVLSLVGAKYNSVLKLVKR